MDKLQLLKDMSFGSQVAEEEIQKLQSYFVQTDQWNRILKGDVDIVRGEKGSGKSAIYLLLGKNTERLFDDSILIVNGENIRGATVFKDLISSPPTSEPEFVILWKIYILVIVSHKLRDMGINGARISSVYSALEAANLLEIELNLAGILRSAQNFTKRLLGTPKIEAGVELDPQTGAPSGIIGRISLAEPTGVMREKGINSIDGYFTVVNEVLTESKYSIWVLLDRLNVAFAENHNLEANAIRALLRVYSDLRGLDQISLKIFLREDIWKRITDGGLREASHITRYIVMKWTPSLLLNLIVTRLLSNEAVIGALGLDRDSILRSADDQRALFNRVFPAQVDQGEKKANTLDWMVSRCTDGTGNTAPRELIHLLNCIREEEVKRLEMGGEATPGDQLFDRSVFKQALPTVSSSRLNTYLYAEFPSEKPYLEKLKNEKSEQTPESLAKIWGLERREAVEKAADLSSLGFFETRGTKAEPSYWVPFLYRDALNLVQGKADKD